MFYQEEKYNDMLNKREEQIVKKINKEINIRNKFNLFIDKEIQIPIKIKLEFDNVTIKEQFDWDLSNGLSINKFCNNYGARINLKKDKIELLKEEISAQILNYISNYNESEDESEDDLSGINDNIHINSHRSTFIPYFDFLKKKCEFCNKMSYKFNQQCKNCKLFLIHTKDLNKKSKQYKYTLKFMENLIFHSSFIDDELISRINKSNFESINKLLKNLKMYFIQEENKWNFIKQYSLCFIKNYEDNTTLEFEDEDKKILSELLKKIDKNDTIFELKEKPKSRRGAHLIGLGRNIKHLKKEIENNKKKIEINNKIKYEQIEKQLNISN